MSFVVDMVKIFSRLLSGIGENEVLRFFLAFLIFLCVYSMAIAFIRASKAR